MIGNLSLYRIFAKVAQYLSFSKAAKSLYMSQPAVSQAINQLETELQTRLFTRTTKGVCLTHEGKLLLEYVEPALNLIKAGERKLMEAQNLMAGELKIGVGDTISKHYLLPYLEQFHSTYPNIKLQIVNRTTFELCRLLKSGQIDLAICNLPIEDPIIEVKQCFEVEDIFVCGKAYKAKLQEPLSLSEIAELPLILLEEKANSRKYVEKYMLAAGVKIEPEIELGSHELLLEFAKYNLGVACVVKEFSKEYLEDGEIVPIEMKENIPKRSVGVCHLKSVSLPPAAATFISILK